LSTIFLRKTATKYSDDGFEDGFWSCQRIKLLPKLSIYLSISFADVSVPKLKNTLQLQKPSLEVHNFSRELFSQEK
jgi:hypothetical protein